MPAFLSVAHLSLLFLPPPHPTFLAGQTRWRPTIIGAMTPSLMMTISTQLPPMFPTRKKRRSSVAAPAGAALTMTTRTRTTCRLPRATPRIALPTTTKTGGGGGGGGGGGRRGAGGGGAAAGRR